jgi:hypothetical protein
MPQFRSIECATNGQSIAAMLMRGSRADRLTNASSFVTAR